MTPYSTRQISPHPRIPDTVSSAFGTPDPGAEALTSGTSGAFELLCHASRRPSIPRPGSSCRPLTSSRSCFRFRRNSTRSRAHARFAGSPSSSAPGETDARPYCTVIPGVVFEVTLLAAGFRAWPPPPARPHTDARALFRFACRPSRGKCRLRTPSTF
ncbi:hypothetical protein OH77DRAFT_810222 [Trametes cingulata]|nr:hypothetical protein OH77DRAFT_810222 [Trametes cingulata]